MERLKQEIRDMRRTRSGESESILYAQPSEEIVVIKIRGRGNHQTSLALRKVLELTATPSHCPRYIFDLETCSTMDSTFMGVLASIGLRQLKVRGAKSVAVNMTPHVYDQLDLLGLKFVIEMRSAAPEAELKDAEKNAEFTSVEPPEFNKCDRIIMMIEAHERLIDVDGKNEVKFKGVLQSLRESLKRTPSQ